MRECFNCKHLKNDYCSVLKHVIRNGYASEMHAKECDKYAISGTLELIVNFIKDILSPFSASEYMNEQTRDKVKRMTQS